MTSKCDYFERSPPRSGDSERMMEMSIRQIARLTDGKVTLSEMPPLAGENEPIGRIVRVRDKFRSGDLVFVEDAETECLEALQLHGATGVAAQREFAPLAGCFGLFVADVQTALQRVAEYCRDRYLGRLIVSIVPSGQADDLRWQLINMDQAAPLCKVNLDVRQVSQLKWCDADEVLITGLLSEEERNFVVTYLPTSAPIRLAG